LLVSKRFQFEAGHLIPGHPTCGTAHGHSFAFEVTVKGPLRENGMVIDFKELKNALKEFIDTKLDHCFLNDTVSPMPTAEVLSLVLFDELEQYLEKHHHGVLAYSVTVWETADNAASCTKDDYELYRHRIPQLRPQGGE